MLAPEWTLVLLIFPCFLGGLAWDLVFGLGGRELGHMGGIKA